MGAWGSYWDALWSPQWAAGLTQGLVATGLGLAGAYFVLVRQFRHDRELAVEQAQADVRSRAADEAGVHFVRAADSLEALTREQLEERLTAGAPPWEEDIRAADGLTWRVVKERPPDLLGLAHTDANLLWRLLGEERSLLALFDADFAYALEIELTPFAVKLRQTGEAYRRWNGYGPVDLPSFAEYPFVLPGHADDADGAAIVQRMLDLEPLLLGRFDATLARLRERHHRALPEAAEPPSE